MSRFLYLATYIFLALPYALLLGGWFRQPYGAAAIVLLLTGVGFGCWGVVKHFRERPAQVQALAEAKDWWQTLWPVAVILLIVGFGGLGYQDTDWLRGNAVVWDLVHSPWPVVYGSEDKPVLLVYYTAFYLPAAAVGKVFGWGATNAAIFLWGAIGLCLTALWVRKLTGVRRWWTTALFLAFSGMDAAGVLIRLPD